MQNFLKITMHISKQITSVAEKTVNLINYNIEMLGVEIDHIALYIVN